MTFASQHASGTKKNARSARCLAKNKTGAWNRTPERGTKQSGQPAPTGDASEACSCWTEREKTDQINSNEMRNQENLGTVKPVPDASSSRE
jgi:hypothetical protein